MNRSDDYSVNRFYRLFCGDVIIALALHVKTCRVKTGTAVGIMWLQCEQSILYELSAWGGHTVKKKFAVIIVAKKSYQSF